MRTETEELAKDCDMLRAFMISELPFGWTREVDQDYNIVYYDRMNKETVYTHPLAQEFRMKFHKLYSRKDLVRVPHQSINDNSSIAVDKLSQKKIKIRRVHQEAKRDMPKIPLKENNFKNSKNKDDKKKIDYEKLYNEDSVKAQMRYKRLFEKIKNTNMDNRSKTNNKYVIED